MANFISEDQIEQALLQRLQHQCGYDVLNCFTAAADELNDGSGRSDKREVLLTGRLRAAVQRLNPEAPAATHEQAVALLTQPRTAMSQIAANREVDALIRSGVPVEYEAPVGAGANAGKKVTERLRVIDFDAPDHAALGHGRNEYLAVSQLWVRGDKGYRRPDVLLYVNGLPLVFIELKNSNVKLKAAYDKNLTNYRVELPQLFTCNALCFLSNGLQTRVGSLTAQWEHFFAWLRVDDEKESLDRAQLADSALSVERAVLGLLKPERLLDYVENFIVFYRETNKVIALAANLAAEAERHIREGLSEDELELFDLLSKETMTKDETQRVKLAAKRLLKRLVEEHPKLLVQDWFKDNQTQRRVRSEIERVLNDELPQSYERTLFAQKCDNVFNLVVDFASRGRKWAA
jgi:type I restriction enzyme, R subunit